MKYIKLMLVLMMVSPVFAQSKLTVTSSAFKANAMIPAKYTCEGVNVNPPLIISHIPAGTKSLALTIHDPDAPKPGGVTHWVIWNLPAERMIHENFKGGMTGQNSDKKNEYKGMCPPDGTHHYNIKVYALNTMLTLPAGTDKATLEKAVQGHVLATGLLTGLYHKTR